MQKVIQKNKVVLRSNSVVKEKKHDFTRDTKFSEKKDVPEVNQ